MSKRLVICQAAVFEEPWRFYSHQCRNTAKGRRQMDDWDPKKPTAGNLVDADACGVHLRSKYAPRLFRKGPHTF